MTILMYPYYFYQYWRNTLYILRNRKAINYLLNRKFQMDRFRYSVLWIRSLNTIPAQVGDYRLKEQIPILYGAKETKSIAFILSVFFCGIASFIPILNRSLMRKAYAIDAEYDTYFPDFYNAFYFTAKEYAAGKEKQIRMSNYPFETGLRPKQIELWGIV